MILLLRDLCDDLSVLPPDRPFVLGSADPSTTWKSLRALIGATKAINGRSALAYATDKGGALGQQEVNEHRAREFIQVVFGYHTNFKKTVVGHELECPATAGKHVKCGVCRRCFGPE